MCVAPFPCRPKPQICHLKPVTCRPAQVSSRHGPVTNCRPEPPCVVTDIPKRDSSYKHVFTSRVANSFQNRINPGSAGQRFIYRSKLTSFLINYIASLILHNMQIQILHLILKYNLYSTESVSILVYVCMIYSQLIS